MLTWLSYSQIEWVEFILDNIEINQINDSLVMIIIIMSE
jgi:hypothetical protein